MNLNQAAHGDREFAVVQTRIGVERKTVFGHVSDPAVQASVGRWARAAAGHHPRQPRAGRRGQHAQRRRDRGRQGRGRDPLRRVGEHVGCERPGGRCRPSDRAEVDGLVDEYLDTYQVARSCDVAGRRSPRVPAGRRGHRGGPPRFLDAGGFRAFTTNFEDLGGLRQLGLAVQRLMADGYGFGGEGDWKTAALLRAQGDGGGPARGHVLHGGLHVPPRSRCPEDPGRPHARGLPVDRGGHAVLRGAPARDRRSGGSVRLVFDAAPGPAVVVGLADLGATSGSSPARSTRWRPTSRCRRCRWPGRCGRLVPTCRWRRPPWLMAGGPHHTVYSRAVDRETLDDFATIAGVELAVIHAGTSVSSFRNELVERRVAPPRPGSVTPCPW